MSKHVKYDIGTEILYETCFVHNSTQKASPEKRSPLSVYIFLCSIFLAYQNKIKHTFQKLTFLDSQLSFFHIVAKLMSNQQICLKCVENDSQILSS